MNFRRPLAAAAALSTLFIAACDGRTTGADQVTPNSARLNYEGHCDTGDQGRIYVEYQRTALNPTSDPWTRVYGGAVLPDGPDAGTDPDPCPSRVPASGEAAGGIPVSGLSASTQYRYRIGFDFTEPSGEAYTDSDGGVNSGNAYHTFTTGSACTRTVAAGTAFSTAVSGLGSGSKLCLSSGSYNWGEVTPPAGVEIEGLGGVTINGGFNVVNDGVTLDNFRIELTAGVGPATILILADNVTAQRLHIDNNNIGDVQGYIVGNGGVQTSNVRILDNVIHNMRGSQSQCADTPGMTSGHNKIHAIYWANGVDGEVRRTWMYSVGGFGLHFYSGAGGSAAGTDVSQTVTDDSVCNFGNVFDSISGPTTFDHTIVTDPNAGGGWWSCQSAGSTITNSRAQGGYFGGCTAGNVTADTTYQDEVNHDYRVPGNPNHQFTPGNF